MLVAADGVMLNVSLPARPLMLMAPVSAATTFTGSKASTATITLGPLGPAVIASLALVPLTVTVLLPPSGSMANAPAAAETLEKLNTLAYAEEVTVAAAAPVGVT